MIHCCLALPLALSLPLQDTEPMTLRWYDLRPIVAAARPVQGRVSLGVPFERWGKDFRFEGDIDEWATLGTDDVLAWIRESALRSDGAELTRTLQVDGMAAIEANGRGHAIAGDSLGLFAAATGGQARIELTCLPIGRAPEAARGTLTPVQAGALFADLATEPRSERRVPLGQLTRVASQGHGSYVGDVEVEVGRFVSLSDPAIYLWPEGLEAAVRVSPTAAEGRWLVSVRARRCGRVRPGRTQALAPHGGMEIELPEGPYETVAASGIVEPGGGVALRLGATDTAALVLRVHPPAPPRDPRIVELGSLLATLDSAPRPRFGEVQGRWDPAGDEPPERAEDRKDARTVAEAWLAEALGRVEWDAQRRVEPPRAIFGSSEPPLARLRAAAQAHAEALTGFDVDVAFGPVSPSVARELLASPEASANHLPHRATLTAVSGTASAFVRGYARSYVADHAVSVSQAASAVTPRVTAAVNGAAVWLRPSTPREGAVRLELETRWIEGFADTPRARVLTAGRAPLEHTDGPRDLSTQAVVPLDAALEVELAVAHMIDVQEVLTAALGRWSIASVSRVPGSDQLLVVAVRPEVAR